MLWHGYNNCNLSVVVFVGSLGLIYSGQVVGDL